jgi:hypothetical protein
MSFLEEADGQARGLSWSDFAVLFCSVSKDSGPLSRMTVTWAIRGNGVPQQT